VNGRHYQVVNECTMIFKEFNSPFTGEGRVFWAFSLIMVKKRILKQ
jgi:hypothetical protein